MHHNWKLGLCGLAASTSITLMAWGQEGQQQPMQRGAPIVDAGLARLHLQSERPGVKFFELGERITRVYGPAFGGGASPHDAAQAFIDQHVDIFGIQPTDLVPVGPFEDGRHLQPIMYENGQPKFTGVYYTQVRSGIEVFRTRLMLLARNEANYPLVLATSGLRDIGAFAVDAQALNAVNAAAGVAQARKSMPAGSIFTPARTVIFAGVDLNPHPPTLAVVFEGEGGDPLVGDYSKQLFVTNAATGDVLYTESLVHEVDVTGNVSALCTEGHGADFCGDESPHALPYARVSIGATTVHADALGNFTIPNAGTGQVTVVSPVAGLYFTVNNNQGNAVINEVVTPPGPVNILHNPLNASEFTRAEVNTYLHANVIRDLVLQHNPAYPTIAGQTNFPINANIGQNCNAFYNGSSINFYVAGGGCPNTGFATVVHHEYGHHIVNTGGSGQGAYGEGMSDCMGILVSDESWTGIGWSGSCASGLRNADNTCQYQTSGCSSCGSAIHSCGRLISGCVWDLREQLLLTHPSTYREILANLTINSVLLHDGTGIAPDITIDFLTLDDDDGDIDNGTPHRQEIAAAFGAHNMPAPPLAELLFSYPDGRPASILPGGGTVLRVDIDPNAGTLNPASPRLNVNSGSGFAQIPMTQVDANTFDAVFPASTCGANVAYYISATTNAGASATSPGGAPANSFSALSAVSVTDVFADNFQTDQGWVVTNDGALTDGQWDRGVPITNCNRGNPVVDGDASGACYLTDNSSAGACNSDVDGGTTTLTSPTMDATGDAVYLSYWRWYSNVAGASPNADTFVVQYSSNDGSTWQALETVGPGGPEAGGGWYFRQFNLNSLPGATTNAFKVRFLASDLGSGSVVEAAVDGVKLQRLVCGSSIPGDINGDGSVDIDDLLAVIAAWGACPAPPTACPADVVLNGQVDIDDLLFVISNWG